MSNHPILEDKGKVSTLEAKLKAPEEFQAFRKVQDKLYVSDFDRMVKMGVEEENSDQTNNIQNEITGKF